MYMVASLEEMVVEERIAETPGLEHVVLDLLLFLLLMTLRRLNL